MTETIRVKVLFFGAIADIVGQRSEEIEASAGPSETVFDSIVNAHPGIASHKLLFSINQAYATGKEVLQDGDELAIFTAVSGG